MLNFLLRALVAIFALVYVAFPLLTASERFDRALVVTACVPDVSPSRPAAGNGLCAYEGRLERNFAGDVLMTTTAGQALRVPGANPPAIITYGDGYTAWTYVIAALVLAAILVGLFPWRELAPLLRQPAATPQA